MTHRLGLKSWATGALVLAAISACAGTGTDPGPVANTAPAATVASSSSGPTTSPSSAAATDATAAMHRYFAVIDLLSQHPKSDLRALRSVTVSTELSAERRFLAGEHRRGEQQRGDTRIAKLNVQAVNLDNSDPSAGKIPTVTIDLCWDVTHVDVFDQTGKSIVSASRPSTGWTRYDIANYEYTAHPDDGWRVASAQDLKQSPCAAS